MSIEDFFNLFLIISSVHGFIFCSSLYFSKQGKTRTFIFINFLVLSISLNNFQSWVLVKNFFRGNHFLKYFEIPWHFLIAPFFYLFLINYLEVKKKNLTILKVVVPTFILFLFIRLGFYFSNSYNISTIAPFFRKYVIIEEIISSIFSLLLFVYSYRIYKFSKRQLNNLNSFDNLNWIGIFFTLGLLVYIFWFIPLLITVSFNFKVFMPSYYPLRVFTTILVYLLGYQSILRLRILNEKKYLRKYSKNRRRAIPQERKKQLNLDKNIENTAKTINISTDIIKNVLKGLEEFENEKQYSSQYVTLNSLAKQLNTNTNYLSKIINHYKEASYTNYINNLRINNIVEQLEANPKIRKFTIKAIAQEAGFGNSDSFSKVFHRLKGKKPSDFIKGLK